ncbi:MAG: hypothetical protein HDS16_06325 [Bacteroides sp.]|nr:hypothetical protein [Bacteroides sp.]
MKSFQRIVLALLTISIQALPLLAVTEKEMEEARTITAKSYLRYVNNGSGYLDEINAKSMAELTPRLKAKEKENLQAFNAVKVPADYAKWDKKQLVEYWAATFFTSPGLDANGKAARSRVRKYIEGMTISTASAPQEAASSEQPQAETPAPVPAPAEQPAQSAEVTADTPDGTTPAEPEDLLAEQKEIEKAIEETRENREPEQSNTWVYVLVLAILVGIVIWLVVYAANLMKRQPGGENSHSSNGDGSDSELREQARKAIAAKNQELKQVQEQLQAAEARNSEIQARLEQANIDLKTLNESVARLKEENRQLRLRSQSDRTQEATRAAAPAPIAAPKPETRAGAQATLTQTPKTAPVAPAPSPRTIYLGRVNKRGIFVRADRKVTPGHSVYALHTNDGLVGTFQVVNEPGVVDLVLNDPEEYLGMGCTGEDLEDTVGVSAISTKSAGTAIFENGYWKVLRKTRIQYE